MSKTPRILKLKKAKKIVAMIEEEKLEKALITCATLKKTGIEGCGIISSCSGCCLGKIENCHKYLASSKEIKKELLKTSEKWTTLDIVINEENIENIEREIINRISENAVKTVIERFNKEKGEVI